jgi:hypothetical protein
MKEIHAPHIPFPWNTSHDPVCFSGLSKTFGSLVEKVASAAIGAATVME